MGQDALELTPGVKLVTTLEHDSDVGRIAWSPGGRILAAPLDKKLRLWDWEARNFKETKTHTSGIKVTFNQIKVTFNQRSNLLAVCGHGGVEIFVSAFENDLRAVRFLDLGNDVGGIAFQPHLPILMTSHPGEAALWNYETGEKLKTFASRFGSVCGIGFSPMHNILVHEALKGPCLL